MLEIAMDDLKQAAVDFYNMTKIKIVLYDSGRNVLFSYPDTMCEFCTRIRSSQDLAKKCIDCDNVGFDMCDAIRAPYIYKCHLNLSEAIAPIYENGITIGYMMLGQVLLDTQREAALKAAKEIAPKHGLDTQKLLSELSGLKTVNNEFINSAVSMMSMCACYLYYNRIISNKADLLHLQLKQYIDTHLDEDLSVKRICNDFFISKSKLYTISNEFFGMGISDYIRNLRVEEAKKLLRKGNLQISQIAKQTGFADANYFSRMFKQTEGVTPMMYRNAL